MLHFVLFLFFSPYFYWVLIEFRTEDCKSCVEDPSDVSCGFDSGKI